MKREIGSEFHSIPIENGYGLTLPRPGTLVFSGRTAIETVLGKLPNANTALLPSYCCDSMIVPFRAAGLKVKHYDVKWRDGLKVKINDTADILLWVNYFGYRNEMPEFDGVIIEDATHSFLSIRQYHERSDYLVASLRKWEPVNCGGYCSVDAEGEEPTEEFITLKRAAMTLKSEYLFDHDEEKKPRFLSMFDESNHWLAEHYSGLLIDSWSRDYLSHVDIEGQRRIRRENAKVIYEGLKGKAQFMFHEEDMDCPLFVPIILPNRDEVRRKLTEAGIYCPVHWPKPEGYSSNIYDMELSLICDQRYNTQDMERMIEVLLKSL